VGGWTGGGVVVVVGGAAGGGAVGSGPGFGPRVVVGGGEPLVGALVVGSGGLVVVGGVAGLVVVGAVVAAPSGPLRQNNRHFGGSIATWTVCIALPSVPTTVTVSDSARRW
jgi:hypothetical protein